MIPKDLKVGDTFVDGEQTYQVVEVQDNGNYIARAVVPGEAKPTKTKKVGA